MNRWKFSSDQQPTAATIVCLELPILREFTIELRPRHLRVNKLVRNHRSAPPTPAFRFRNKRTSGGKLKSAIFWSKESRAPAASLNSQLSGGCPALPVCSSARAITVRKGAFLFARISEGT